MKRFAQMFVVVAIKEDHATCILEGGSFIVDVPFKVIGFQPYLTQRLPISRMTTEVRKNPNFAHLHWADPSALPYMWRGIITGIGSERNFILIEPENQVLRLYCTNGLVLSTMSNWSKRFTSLLNTWRAKQIKGTAVTFSLGKRRLKKPCCEELIAVFPET